MFGSVNFVQILFIPLFGKYLNKLKAHRLFVNGVFICGAANIAFGFLQWVETMPTFLALSFAIRIISAIGEAAFLTSLYPLATKVRKLNTRLDWRRRFIHKKEGQSNNYSILIFHRQQLKDIVPPFFPLWRHRSALE